MSRPASRSPRGALRRRVLRNSGGRQPELPQHPDDGGTLRRFREDPTAIPFRRRAGASRSSRRRSRAIAMRTVRAIRIGWRRQMSPGPARRSTHRQPASTRLHSQLDFGGHSTEAKHRGREVARMHPRTQMPVVSPTATLSACSTRVAPALLRCVSRRQSPPGLSSCRPVPGTTRWIRTKSSALCSRKSECAHARHRHLILRARMHRSAHDCRGGALQRQSAADPRFRSHVADEAAAPRSRREEVNRESPCGSWPRAWRLLGG